MKNASTGATRVRARIAAVGAYFPSRVVDNEELLSTLTASFRLPGPDVLQRIFGIRTRHVAEPDEQVSDLAAAAARPMVDAVGRNDIDLLLFAAACADLIEPATANIVQQKLGLRCPALDIKNACNSFVSAMQVAAAFIEAGTYRRVLIASGEKLSDALRRQFDDEQQFQESLAALTLGDAGAAMLLEPCDQPDRGIIFQRFASFGAHWKLCTIQGGGSLHPRDMDAYYFRGQTAALRSVIENEATAMWQACQPELGWSADEIAWVFTHQVSDGTRRAVIDLIGVPPERCVDLFPARGNIAAAAIPACMAAVHDRLRPGDKLLLVGLAAGIALSYQAVVW